MKKVLQFKDLITVPSSLVLRKWYALKGGGSPSGTLKGVIVIDSIGSSLMAEGADNDDDTALACPGG